MVGSSKIIAGRLRLERMRDDLSNVMTDDDLEEYKEDIDWLERHWDNAR